MKYIRNFLALSLLVSLVSSCGVETADYRKHPKRVATADTQLISSPKMMNLVAGDSFSIVLDRALATKKNMKGKGIVYETTCFDYSPKTTIGKVRCQSDQTKEQAIIVANATLTCQGEKTEPAQLLQLPECGDGTYEFAFDQFEPHVDIRIYPAQ